MNSSETIICPVCGRPMVLRTAGKAKMQETNSSAAADIHSAKTLIDLTEVDTEIAQAATRNKWCKYLMD